MRFRIPNDWDEKTWKCYQLSWPDSDRWLWLLQGILSGLAKGRTWDEKSGSILDAVDFGERIWVRNNALIACADEPAGETCQVVNSSGCGGFYTALDFEDENMPCLDLSGLIKIEDGKLWVKDSCCAWVEIGSLEGVTENLPDNPLNPDDDPAVTYSACGKAYAGARILYSVAENMWDEYDNYPWQWIGHVESGVGLDLDNKWIIAGCNQSIIMHGLTYEKDDIINDDDEAWLRCQIAALLGDDELGATEDQFNDIRSAIKSHAGFDPFLMNYWDYVFFALGWKDFSDITALGATDTTQDCNCPAAGIPDPTTSWDTFDWSYFWDFTKSQGDWVANNVLTEYVAGQGWVDWADSGTGYVKTSIKIPLGTFEASTNFKRYWALIHVGTNFDYSGDLVRIGVTGTDNLYGASSPGGDPVTTGGDLTIDHYSAHMRAAEDVDFRMVAEGHVTGVSGSTDPRSFRILAIAVAGSGDDPFLA